MHNHCLRGDCSCLPLFPVRGRRALDVGMEGGGCVQLVRQSSRDVVLREGENSGERVLTESVDRDTSFREVVCSRGSFEREREVISF